MYLAGNEGAPPREHLVRAVSLGGRWSGLGKPRALDIGCGPGRETLFLLRAGYEVVAFDPYPEMLERARELIAREPDAANLEPRVRFEHATLEAHAPTLEPSSFDLVHAGFVLPFVLPARFDECFARLAGCLRTGGLFSGQFFGRDDEFIRTADAGTMSCHSREEIDRLLQPFEVLEIEEINRPGRIGKGREKWWHVFHVTARHR
jgi:SAM-dependent methyltransferase